MLATGIVMLLVLPDIEANDPERALAAFFGMLVIIALLIDVDVMEAWRQWRNRGHDKPVEQPADIDDHAAGE